MFKPSNYFNEGVVDLIRVSHASRDTQEIHTNIYEFTLLPSFINRCKNSNMRYDKETNTDIVRLEHIRLYLGRRPDDRFPVDGDSGVMEIMQTWVW